MRRAAVIGILVLILLLGGSGMAEDKDREENLLLFIDGAAVDVDWEENESVSALRALAAAKPLEISMSMYGGFEQVGPLGANLPRQDVQTQTDYGDIVLYSGNQIVIFYGSNSWAYTRLGHIRDVSQAEMKAMLGQRDVTITLALEEENPDDASKGSR